MPFRLPGYIFLLNRHPAISNYHSTTKYYYYAYSTPNSTSPSSVDVTILSSHLALRALLTSYVLGLFHLFETELCQNRRLKKKVTDSLSPPLQQVGHDYMTEIFQIRCTSPRFYTKLTKTSGHPF